MILYHGSNQEVREPRLSYSRKSLDFGAGFYMTTDLEQANSWTIRVARVRKFGAPIVNVYETNERWPSLETLRFESANRQWLDFVTAHRTGRATENDCDVVVGPIANDRTIDVLNLYLAGTITQSVALELLLPQKLKNQYVLKTQRAIDGVCFTGVKNV